MNKLPKIKFRFPSLEREADMFSGFCHPRPTGWDWSERIYNKHPKLKELVLKNGLKDKKIFLDYVRQYKKENKKELLKSKIDFEKDWNKFGDKYLKILSDYFGTDYPKEKKFITIYISINPICPRFLDDWSFFVRYNRPEYFRRIVAHEIQHFLYFKKWKEIFPKTKRREMDSPHLIWKLSEILDPIILNHHPKIQKIVSMYAPGYREFQNIKIGKKKLIPYFENLYKKHLKDKSSFEDFLKTCYIELDKHEKIIKNI